MMYCIVDFATFVSSVINKVAFDKIKGYIDYAKESKEATIIAGGKCNKHITLTLFTDPDHY